MSRHSQNRTLLQDFLRNFWGDQRAVTSHENPLTEFIHCSMTTILQSVLTAKSFLAKNNELQVVFIQDYSTVWSLPERNLYPDWKGEKYVDAQPLPTRLPENNLKRKGDLSVCSTDFRKLKFETQLFAVFYSPGWVLLDNDHNHSYFAVRVGLSPAVELVKKEKSSGWILILNRMPWKWLRIVMLRQ